MTLAMATATVPVVPTGTWTIDCHHSVVGFSIRHLMSKVRGRFIEFSGKITVSDDSFDSTVSAAVDLTSVNTGNQMRDTHLRTGDFFDVARYPTMTFVSTRLRQVTDSWILEGDLTIKDTTKAICIELDFLGFDPTGMQGEPRLGFEGRTSIRRSDFGISFGLADGAKLVIGDQVDIVLDIEATRDDQKATSVHASLGLDSPEGLVHP
jgi:polyisoprenoid-binding protein YceI